MNLYLGIDIGTFETKAVLVRQDGSIAAEARRAHRMAVPRPGWAEHDAELDWWGELCAVARELAAAAAPGALRAMAVSAIGPCLVPVDGDGRALMPAILYGVDARAAAEVAELTGRIGSERLIAATGNPLTSQAVGPKILWLQRHRPEVWARTARLHTATSFLVERLTGTGAIDHYTAAGFGPLYDIGSLAWSGALAPEIAGVEMLPRLGWSDEVAGGLTAAAAAATGLPAGLPVTVGTIDAAAEALSVGVRAPGDTMLMYGSTVFVIAVTDRPVRDRRLWAAPWLFAGQHAAMAGLATSGTLTHWFRDVCARELPAETAFATLAAEAAAVSAGAEGLILLPYFSGERTPVHDPQARGVWFGMNLTHGRGHLYRALIEGIAFGTAHAFEAMAAAGAAPVRLRAVGGGVKNAVWAQATSDATGLAQGVCATTVGASYGDAFLAALAVGEVRAGDIDRWNPEASRVTPAEVPAYRRQYPLWKALYQRTADLMAALGEGI